MLNMSKDASSENIVKGVLDYHRSNYTRRLQHMIWYRNILYYMGEQWLSWSKERSTFTKRYRSDLIPTPVANKVKDAVRSEKALILNKKYIPKVWPNSKQLTDLSAAQIGEFVLRDMDVRNEKEFEDQLDILVKWMLLTGVGFTRTYPDMDRGEYGIDADGNLISSGEVVTDALSPFSVIMDPLGVTLRRKKYLGVLSNKDKDWVEDTFEIKVGPRSDEYMNNYNRMLTHFVGNVSPWKGASLNASRREHDPADQDEVEFLELEFKPTKDYPEGRFIVAANGKVVRDIDRLLIPGDKKLNEWYYSITDFHYEEVPGRYWSESFVNDLISPQDQINQIDQALVMNRRSLGRPRIIMPTNCKIERLNEQGQNFIAIKYDPRLSGGVKPEFSNGLSLPNQILNERTVHESTVQEASGDPKNVLKGQVPTAGASGLLVDMLQETAEAAHSPMINKFYRALSRVYRKRLILASELYTEERLIKVAGANEEVEIRKFKSAELRGNTDVRLELSSGAFKTKASMAQSLLMLMQSGMFAGDPVTKREILIKLGLADLIGDTSNVHSSRAEKENKAIACNEEKEIFITANPPSTLLNQETGDIDAEAFMNADIAVNDPLFKFDNHAIHMESHMRFMMGDEFVGVSDKAKEIFSRHVELHKMLMEAEVKKAQIEALQMQQAQAIAQQPQLMQQQQEEERPTVSAPSPI